VYDTDQLATKEHVQYQEILQGCAAGSAEKHSDSASTSSALVHVANVASDSVALPGTSTSTNVASKCDGRSLFAGAVFNNCVFNLNTSAK
jgi:hypothetical protein